MCSKSELSSHHLSHTNLERRVQPYLPSKRPQCRLAASSIETGKDPTVLHQVLHATFRQLFGVSLFTALWETLCLPGTIDIIWIYKSNKNDLYGFEQPAA